MLSLSRESSDGVRPSKVSIPKYVLEPDLWYRGGRFTVHCWELLWRNVFMCEGIRNGIDMELPEAILVGKGRGPFTVGITWRKRQTKKVALSVRVSGIDMFVAFYSSVRSCGGFCSLTMAASGPAWSSRSSRSSPMMSASNSWLLSSNNKVLLVLHPFTKVDTGRGTDVGTDTGRVTDSKPGGSDGGADKILLLEGSSSTIVSFRGEGDATGTWIGVGRGTKRLLSWVNWGTSERHEEKRGEWCISYASLMIKSKAAWSYKTYQFLYLQLKTSHERTEWTQTEFHWMMQLFKQTFFILYTV